SADELTRIGRQPSRLSILEQETSETLVCRDKRDAYLPSERSEILEFFVRRFNGVRARRLQRFPRALASRHTARVQAAVARQLETSHRLQYCMVGLARGIGECRLDVVRLKIGKIPQDFFMRHPSAMNWDKGTGGQKSALNIRRARGCGV